MTMIQNLLPSFQAVAAGHQKFRIDASGIILSRFQHEPNVRLAPHSHSNFSMVFALSGTMQETCYGKTWSIKPGDTIIKPAGYVHSNKYGAAGFDALYLEITEAAQNRLKEFESIFRMEGIRRNSDVLTTANRLAECVIKNPSAFYQEILDCSRGWMKSVMESAALGSDKSWPNELRLSLHVGYLSQFKLDQLAANCGVHSVHAVRSFRSKFGCTIGEYLRNLRLRHAIGMLVESDQPIVQVAADSGFSDQSHLTRLCKRITGHTPGSVRSSYGAGGIQAFALNR